MDSYEIYMGFYVGCNFMSYLCINYDQIMRKNINNIELFIKIVEISTTIVYIRRGKYLYTLFR